MSETCRCSWDDVFRKPAVEFLNILSYRKDRDSWRDNAMKKYQREN